MKLSNLLKSGGRALSEATKAATMEAFLPTLDGGLQGEIRLGSLAFARDQYPRMRASLIDLDALDDSHVVLDGVKTLAVAPLKTLLLLRRGRESTYAKKEAAAFGAAYVALHWNPNDEDAAEQLLAAVHGITTWMRGDRTVACPYLPDRKPENAASAAEVVSGNARVELVKTKKKSLDFSAEVLKGKPTGVRMSTENTRIVMRIGENQKAGGDGQSEKLVKLAAEIKALKKNLTPKK